jgi:hypothetical protein
VIRRLGHWIINRGLVTGAGDSCGVIVFHGTLAGLMAARSTPSLQARREK